MVLLQFAVPRKNTNITKHGECVPKNFGKPMTLQHSWWIPPPPLSWSMRSFDGFLWCFLTLTVSTYLKYDSMTYLWSNGGKNVVVIHIEMNPQYKTYPTNKRKTNAMVSSKDKKTINANHQTSQWRPPYSVGSPSGGHDVRRQRSRFSDPPPLKVPEATDSANIWCKFWIPHLSFFTRSYIFRL